MRCPAIDRGPHCYRADRSLLVFQKQMRLEANGESNVIYTLSEFHLALQDLHWSLFGSAAGLKCRLIVFVVLTGTLLAAADHCQAAEQG